MSKIRRASLWFFQRTMNESWDNGFWWGWLVGTISTAILVWRRMR